MLVPVEAAPSDTRPVEAAPSDTRPVPGEDTEAISTLAGVAEDEVELLDALLL